MASVCPSSQLWIVTERAFWHTVLFRAGVYDTGTSMCELGQLHTVFLAQQGLVMSTLSNVVDLDSLVALSGHA